MNRNDILNTAERIINGDRQKTYGKPEDSFELIADFWNLYLNNLGHNNLDGVDVAKMMILMKLARSMGGEPKADNWVDICGYAALAAEMEESLHRLIETLISENGTVYPAPPND